jgi:hypothetical protein
MTMTPPATINNQFTLPGFRSPRMFRPPARSISSAAARALLESESNVDRRVCHGAGGQAGGFSVLLQV